MQKVFDVSVWVYFALSAAVVYMNYRWRRMIKDNLDSFHATLQKGLREVKENGTPNLGANSDVAGDTNRGILPDEGSK